MTRTTIAEMLSRLPAANAASTSARQAVSAGASSNAAITGGDSTSDRPSLHPKYASPARARPRLTVGRVDAVRPRHVGVAGGAAHELVDRVDGERARDLAALVAAHAVGDHEQPELGARADRVLVVGAAAGDGEREGVEQHART